MVLICLFLCRSVSMSSLLFPFLVLCLCPNPHFHFLHRSSINLFSLFPSRLHPLPVFQSRRVPPALALPLLFFFPSSSSSGPSISPLLLLLSGLYFSAPDVPPIANIVFLPPPLDMAKEAICALLAILGHFFEAFSSVDLFFALAPFRPASSASPCFPPSRLSSLSASAHPVSSSIPTYSISRPSAQVNIIPAWFPSLSETSARAVFIFRASVA